MELNKIFFLLFEVVGDFEWVRVVDYNIEFG